MIKHLSYYKESEPQMVQLSVESFYVDDFLGGADDIEGCRVFLTSQRNMTEGGFNLRKCCTNSNLLHDKMVANLMYKQSEQTMQTQC